MSKDLLSMTFFEVTSGGVVTMTAPNIRAVHAFTTRQGGVSSGIFQSLNLGENRGDDEEDVRENYAILCDHLGIPADRLVFSRQVHGSAVRLVSSADCHRLFSSVPYEADGLITAERDLALVIFTADCIPILLHDPVAGAIGAVHAGWRGTAADIAGIAIRRMAEEFSSRPEDIRAAIGPGIGMCCFETDAEVPEALKSLPALMSLQTLKSLPALSADFGGLVLEKPDGKFMVDLKGINRRLLEYAGLLPEHIAVSEECTMCSHEKYWSHRYTHGRRGSQASVIMLKG